MKKRTTLVLGPDRGRPRSRNKPLLEKQITDRKQTASTGAGARLAYDVLADMFTLVGVLRPDGAVREINRRAMASAGLTSTDVLGRQIWDCPWWNVDAEAQNRLREACQRGARGESSRYDEIVRLAGEQMLSIDFTLVPLRNGRGEIESLIFYGFDVSARKRTEQALRRSEERLTQAADVMHLGLFEHDRHTDEVYWSPMIRNICGWNDEGPPSLEEYMRLIHAEDRAQTATGIARSQDPAGDGLCDLEHRLLRRDGSVHWVNLRLRTFFEGEGMTRRPGRTIGALLDITERKQLEAQIAQSQKMEAVGRMAGRIVHDFNNILTVVNGYLDLLLGQLDAGSLQYREASEIARAGDRAAKLTQQLLAVSQRQVLHSAPLDLNRVIMDLRTLLSPFMGEHIQVNVEPAVDLGLVMADRMQMEQILMNLAVNARDAMPHGGTLTFETANVLLYDTDRMKAAGAPAGPYVRLSVRDTGQGMDDHTRAHLFEPFFTTKAAGQGTGLGLATVYGVIAESRGFIRVESAPGRGATFHIFLPQVEQTNPHSKTSDNIPGPDTTA